MLLPEPQRRGEIKFLIAKSLLYTSRLALIAFLLAAGFILQFATANLWLGGAILFVGTLLSLVHGYSNIPDEQEAQKEWRAADREKLEKILQINQATQKWDRSFIDITCGRGFMILFLLALLIGFLTFHLSSLGEDWLAAALVVDSAILLVPHWITGVRRILTNPPLIIKIEHYLDAWDAWQKNPLETEIMQAQIQVKKFPNGEIPFDAKLILNSNAATKDFLGLQVQISFNHVEGTDYPYFYCVLVARPDFQLLKKYDRVDATKKATPDNVILERSHEEVDNVDVIVIRQQTTKTSGYHTKKPACLAILTHSINIMREILAIPE
jgi:hypothetical protein